MDTAMYNTIPAANDEPLVQTKAAPTSIFVAPKSTIGTYNFAASEKCHVCCLYPLWCKCC